MAEESCSLIKLLKLINNPSSLNKGNCDGVRHLILISIDILRFYFSVFSLVLVSIEKIHQTLKTVFDHISKRLKVCQKYSAGRRVLISPLLSAFENVAKHSLSCTGSKCRKTTSCDLVSILTTQCHILTYFKSISKACNK